MKQRILGMSLFLALMIMLFAMPIMSNGRERGFSVDNLNRIPSYERYEFRATGSSLQETPVIIEYQIKNQNKNDTYWTIRGSMPLNEVFINEEYRVRLSDLNITEYSRTQNFKRGKHTISGSLAVDNYVEKPTEFIITTLQPIMYLLRTFPFRSNIKEIFVRLPQQKKGKMNLKVKNKGLKEVETEKFGKIKAYNIEVSLVVPIVGAFLPNIDYYFLDDDVHTLIAMKGVFNMTGKNVEVQLVDYRSMQ